MTKSNSLESVTTAFTQWRSTRKSSCARIPDNLRRQALSLLDEYSKLEIISALNINHSTLKKSYTRTYMDTPHLSIL